MGLLSTITSCDLRWFIVICVCPLAICHEQKKNVLFLVADDMRPQINAFAGPDFPSPIHPKMHTPNLDELSSRSLVLKRAHCQQAICSPSRTSLLTGRRPDTTHVYDLKTYFRLSGGNFTTIPQYFKEHGYTSIGIGKIFHPGMKASGKDDPISWSVPYYHAPRYWQSPNISWRAVDDETQKKNPLPDQLIARHAIKTLHNLTLNVHKEPFFLAVGFHKPHLPFIFPDKFLDAYPIGDIRLPDNEYAPHNMPAAAWSVYGELLKYHDIAKLNSSGLPNTTLPKNVVKDLRRAYYCAASFIDELIGDILHELDKLGMSENTIISFWGDHGWQLGEHGEWTKHTNFELATHAPMMIHIPGVTDKGISSEELTEFVDLFPTLVEAAGLPSIPICPKNSTNIKVCTEGDSLMPLIDNPNQSNWKKQVFSQYPRQIHIDSAANHKFNVMGYTMRTERYRYTEWVEFRGAPKYKPKWDRVYGVELYDHGTDPEENNNVFDNPVYNSTVHSLRKKLHIGWRRKL